jgi:hypothetical protein
VDEVAQALVAIHRPVNYFVGGAVGLNVWIDGSRAGKVRIGRVATFAIAPGEHTLSVSMWWHRSRLLPFFAASGSRIDVTVGLPRTELGLKVLLPTCLVGYLTWLAVKILWRAAVLADPLSAVLFEIAMIFVTLGGYVLVTWMFLGDYWILWTLDQSKATWPELPVAR